jgi:hypothetical protein
MVDMASFNIVIPMPEALSFAESRWQKQIIIFIKIDLNFPATLASPSFELATLGIESKTLNPTAMEAYTIKKL